MDKMIKKQEIVHRATRFRHSNFNFVESKEAISSVDFVKGYAATSTPLRLTQAAANWPAASWTLDYLRKQYGAHEVHVRIGNYVKHAFTSNRVFVSTNLGKYIDFLKDNIDFDSFDKHDQIPNVYPPYVGCNTLPEKMLEEIQVPSVLGSNERPATFWLGPARTVTPMHSDGIDNFIAQIIGKKKLILAPAHEYEFLYATLWSEDGKVDSLCRKSPWQPNLDFEKYPLFRCCHLVEVILDPGDILFVPAGWFHYVESLEISLTINFFQTNCYLASSSYTSCDGSRQVSLP